MADGLQVTSFRGDAFPGSAVRLPNLGHPTLKLVTQF
jgi:hypothetical protein